MNNGQDHNIFARTGGGAKPSPRCSLHHFAFLLLDGFSTLSYSAAVETLHSANHAAGRNAFGWVTLSDSGGTVRSSNGLEQAVDAGLLSLKRRTTLLVCGGDGIEKASSSRILAWIREQAAHGCHVGGLSTAAWILAEAGLLASSRTTIHWEYEESFSETFPSVVLTHTPFVIDGNRSATAGGTAAIDLMLEFIKCLVNEDLAIATSERMLYRTFHKIQATSKIMPYNSIGSGIPRLGHAISIMRERLDEEISPDDVAQDIGISVRQLERLFRKNLKQSPKRFLTDMRLDRARRLLLQTDLSVIAVATATGFNSASHFSKSFRLRYGQSPYQMRAA